MRKKLIEFNKKNILDAAKEQFEINMSSTVDDIARRAECSKATIYVYYKNKDDIYYHIVLEYMNSLKKSVAKCFSNTIDYEKAYYDLCFNLAEFESTYPMYFSCILGNIKVGEKEMNDLPVLRDIFNVGEEINIIVSSFLQSAKNNGFVKDINPLETTFVLWSSICGLITLWSSKSEYLEKRLSLKKEEFLRKGFKTILDSIKKGE